jgi:tetratricopeptide (TPR) repeat protein
MTNDKGKGAYLGLDGGEWRVVIEKEGYVTSEGTFPISEAAIGPGRPLTVTLRKVPQGTAGTGEATTTPDRGSEILGWVQQGNELLKQQKYAEARAEYQKALAEVPRDKQLPLLRGIAQTYNQEANAQAAIDTLKSGLEINPDDPETLRLLVSLLVASGKEAEAQQYVARLPADAKTDPNVLLNIGIELYNKKDLDGALAQFNKVVNDYPDNADVRYYRGLVLLNQGKNADAAADFKKLLEIAPNHANAAEAKDFLKYLETQQ